MGRTPGHGQATRRPRQPTPARQRMAWRTERPPLQRSAPSQCLSGEARTTSPSTFSSAVAQKMRLNSGGALAQQLLSEATARPPAGQRQHVQAALRRTPSAPERSGLVGGIGPVGEHAEHDIEPRHPERQPPEGRQQHVDDQKGQNGKQRCGAPLRAAGPRAGPGCTAHWLQLHAARPLALGAALDFEADGLVQLRPAGATRPGRHVHEDRLATLGGLDVAEAPFVVPGGQRAFEAHDT